jgi:hypothetical protein
MKTQLFKHMGNTRHASLLMIGWWTKWIQRVDEVIRPYYIQRGLIDAPTADQRLLSGRLAHPHDLPRASGEPVISRLRVDQICEKERGLPLIGDFVLTRQANAQQPFGLGEVVGHNGERREGELEGEAEHGPGQAEAAESQVEGESPAAAAAAPAGATNNRSRCSTALAPKQPYTGGDDESEGDSDYEERAEGAAPGSTAAAKSTGAAAAAGRKRRVSTSNRRPTKSQSKVARKSGSSASSAVVEASRQPTTFTIRWWDFVELTGKGAIQPNDKHHLDLVVADAVAAASDTEPLDAGKKILDAVATIQRGEFARLPPAMIQHWRQIEYLPSQQYEDSTVARGQLIWWGSQSQMLTQRKKLTKSVWDKLEEDLCEKQDVRNRIPPASNAPASVPPAPRLVGIELNPGPDNSTMEQNNGASEMPASPSEAGASDCAEGGSRFEGDDQPSSNELDWQPLVDSEPPPPTKLTCSIECHLGRCACPKPFSYAWALEYRLQRWEATQAHIKRVNGMMSALTKASLNAADVAPLTPPALLTPSYPTAMPRPVLKHSRSDGDDESAPQQPEEVPKRVRRDVRFAEFAKVRWFTPPSPPLPPWPQRPRPYLSPLTFQPSRRPSPLRPPPVDDSWELPPE